MQVPVSARPAISHASQSEPTSPVIVQGVHVADDLHQVLRADTVDPLLQQRARREVRSSSERDRAQRYPPLALIQGRHTLTDPTQLACDTHGES